MGELLRWGILGTGAIAKKFAEGLPLCGAGVLQAVGSRTLEIAEAFTKDFGGKPYGSYSAVLSDPEVDAVYIALPHHLHCEWTIQAAQAGKHILCEKPFTLNHLEAKTALKAVQEAGVFFMEAFMYRCHPQTLTVRQLIKEGVIGKPLVVHADFGYFTPYDRRHFKLDGSIGGGGLMDVGCYPVSFIRMIAGEEPSKVVFSAEITDRGYDAYGTGLLEFPGGVRGTFGTSVHAMLNNGATVYGENGRIHLPEPWFCRGPLLVQLHSQERPEQIKFDSPPHLWGNQSVVVQQLVAAGKKEAGFMSWRDTLGNMKTLDALRGSAGLRFEHEMKE